MGTQLLWSTIQRGAAMFVPKISGQIPIFNRHLHIITQNILPKSETVSGREIFNVLKPDLLRPVQFNVTQVCGMKYKGRLQRRCRDCYFFACEGRWFVRCKTHPRHKQAQIVKKERNTWILTSVCQKKKRPWF